MHYEQEERSYLAHQLVRRLSELFDSGGESLRSIRSRLLSEVYYILFIKNNIEEVKSFELYELHGYKNIKFSHLEYQYELFTPVHLEDLSGYEHACLLLFHQHAYMDYENDNVRYHLSNLLYKCLDVEHVIKPLFQHEFDEYTVEDILSFHMNKNKTFLFQ